MNVGKQVHKSQVRASVWFVVMSDESAEAVSELFPGAGQRLKRDGREGEGGRKDHK